MRLNLRISICNEYLLFCGCADASPPMNLILAVCHSALVKGDATNFEIEASFGVEASQLYPEVKYITVDQFLDKLA